MPDIKGQLRELQARLVEQMRVNAELEEALRLAEIRALQAQVNPHFLFNTLGTIAGQALLEGADETARVSQALARLLRYTLRQIDKLVTLRQEMSHVRDYLLIQETRFGSRIRATILLEDAAEDCLIPPLTVQPMVENAILHGLERLEQGELLIKAGTARSQVEMVEIVVQDNGVGITPDQLQFIVAELSQGVTGQASSPGNGPHEDDSGPRARGHTTGIGIVNVDRRLKYVFGREHGVTLTSGVGRGTTLTLTFPAITEKCQLEV